MVATYRVRIRSKKCWWPFVAWTLNTAMTNVWLLFRKLHNNSISLLQFERVIVITILESSEPNAVLRLLHYSRKVGNSIRLDTKKHILIKGWSKYCVCKVCKRRSVYLCQRCNLTLDRIHCFNATMNKCNSVNEVNIHFFELFCILILFRTSFYFLSSLIRIK